MQASLNSPRSKLARAQEHIELLDHELAASNAQPQRAIERAHPRPMGTSPSTELTLLDDKPEEARAWALIIGDAANSLRSALDHLVYQLALLDNRRKPREQLLARCQFPISSGPKAFRQRRVGYIGLLNDAHQASIRRLQPYQKGNRERAQRLRLLQSLVNTDKHRYVPLVVLDFSGEPPSLARSGFSGTGVTLLPSGQWVDVESTHTDFPYPRWGPVEAHMKGYFGLQIAWKQRGVPFDERYAVPLLRGIHATVTELVESFAEDFAGS